MSERQELSDVKAALLAARLRGQPLPQADTGAIGPRPAGAPSLPSFGQERLWFLQQLNPRSAAYNMHTAVRLQGALDTERFAAALDLIMRRHAVLRSAFRIDGGRLIQTVTKQVPAVLAVEDLQELPPDTRLAAASRRATDLIRMPFDLEQAPLVRARLLRITQRDHLFVLVIHHIVADEWSIDILRRELAAAYNAPSLDAAVLPPFNVEYTDFAHWQRSRWENGVYSPQLEYWRHQLEGELPPLQLPTDRPRPRVQRFRGAICRKALPDNLLPTLQAVARNADASLFMLLAAALDVLLFRWTGTHDLLVGTPIANRTQPELKQLAGFFLNTLVLRNQVHANQSFTALLSAVRETVLGAFAHQDLPLEKLVDELKPQRDPSYNPLFQVMLVYQKHVQPQPALDGLQAEALQLDYGAAKLDLTLFVTETLNGWEAAWEYNSDLFDAASTERMLDQFVVLLEGIASDPGCAIGRLPLLPASEIALLQSYNDTAAPCP